MGIATQRARVDRLLAQRELAVRAVEREGAALDDAEQEIDAVRQAQEIVQHVAQDIQQQAHRRIASVVTRCLQTVFETELQLRIDFERKRGKTEAKIQFEVDGMTVDPMTASGGGVVDVAAFALRLACLNLSRPPVRRLVLLDEPFRFLSRQYRPRIRQMLELLADEMQMQFVLVTHHDDLRTGKVVEL